MTMAYQQASVLAPKEKRPRSNYKEDDAGDYLSLDRRKKKFDESQQLSDNSRRLSEQDRDYYDHKQWSSHEIAKLRLRGQVPIVINRIQRKIDTIIGIQERAAVDPQAAPRNPNDEQAGEIATDSVRYVCDANEFKSISRGMFKHLCVEGTTGCEVVVEEKNGQMEVVIKKVRWETAFWDGHSREEDFSDAQHLGHATWMYIDDIEQLYGPEAKGVAEDSMTGLGSSGMTMGSYEDRPTQGQWLDVRNRRVLVVDMYCKYRGQWTRSVFCSGGDLIAPVVSEYTDEYGNPVCPIELQSVYVDRENARYGVVRSMIGPQDEINYRRSKFLHLVSTRQTYGNAASIDNVDKVKRELAKPHGHVELSGMAKYGEDFGIIDTTDMAQGQMEMLAEAKGEIDLLGPNAGLMGRQPEGIMGAQSGKAWMAQQQAGLAELASLYAAFNELMLRIYKQVWWRVRQYWDAPRYVRVSDDANAYRFTTVNEPVVDEMGNPVFEIDPQTGQPAIDQQTGQPVFKMQNRPAEMEVDISFENVPDTSTLMEEQFEKLTRLAEAGMPIPPQAIIQASNIRNKREIIEQINQAQQQPPPPDPGDMAKIQMKGQELQMKGQEAQQNAQIKQQELAIKAQAAQSKTQIDAGVKRQELAIKMADARSDIALQEAKRQAALIAAQADMIEAQAKARAAIIKANQKPAPRGNGAGRQRT